MIKIIKKIPLLNLKNQFYIGASYSNEKFYFLQSNNHNIDSFDKSYNKVSNITTQTSYTTVCNANDKNLIYLTKHNDNNYLYVANCEYIEIDKIKLKVPKKYIDEIKSIAYDKNKNCLFILTKKNLYSITTDGYFIKDELLEESIKELAYIRNETSVIRNLNGGCTSKSLQIIEPNFTSVAIICNNKYIAYIKNNCSYISEISNSGHIVKTYYIEENIEINSILNVDNKVKLLVTKKENYSYIYITDLIFLDAWYYENDIDELETICLLDENKQHKCCGKCKNKDKKADIIKSIALIESAISHILENEGKKIDISISNINNTEDFLKVNDSINRVINNIIILEQILYCKLELIISSNNYSDEDEYYQ